MNKKLKSQFIVLVEMLIILAPFLVIAFFTYPIADDYNYGQKVYHVWVLERDRSLRSIIYLLKNTIRVTYENWMHNRGEYSSFIFSCLMPSAFGNHTTWLNAWILIGVSTLAVWKYVDVIFKKWLGFKDKNIYICLPVILFYIVSYLPSVSQGYYWFNGAFYNLLITSVGIIYILDCVYNTLSETKISAKKQIVILILAWMVGGGNYAAILVWGILLFFLLIYFFYDTRKMSKCWLRYAIPFYFFAGTNLLAPCNLNRTMGTESSYIETILSSLIAVPKLYGLWLFKTPFIIVLLIIGILVWNNVDDSAKKRKKIHPVFLIILTYLLAAAMICPVLYAQGFWGKDRVYNVYYMIFMLLTIFDYAYMIRYIKLYFGNGKYKHSRLKWEKGIITLLAIVLIGSMSLGEYSWAKTADGWQYSNIRLAYENLIDKRVFRYRDTMEERLAIYEENQGKNVTVPGIQEDYSLYMYYDIHEEPEDWINQVVAEYYGVKSVKPAIQ